MKNLLLSRKFLTPFVIAFCCLGVLLATAIIGVSPYKGQKGFAETLPGGVKLEMVAIPSGSFMMGSETYQLSQPIHEVTLKPFHIGKYELTQAQWKAVMGNYPSEFKGDDLPVEQLSWDDVQKFCKNLSKMTGKKYSLPSEAEWEYAARAGSTGIWHFGDDESLLGEYAWYGENSGKRTHPVGQKKPNGWGLYDVHGNVGEWVEDLWHDNYKGAPTDGSAWMTGGAQEVWVVRGGSNFGNARLCRSAYRFSYPPNYRFNDRGFRVVMRPPS